MHAIHKKYVTVILFFLMAIAFIFGFQNCGFTDHNPPEVYNSKENPTGTNGHLGSDSTLLRQKQNYKLLSESV